MKPIREINKSAVSKFFIAFLASLFVFSVSIHTHKISVSPDASVFISDSIPAANHSTEDCSACLIHGNIKLSGANSVIELIDSGLAINFIESGLLIPDSYLKLNKPSRSPPTI